MSEPMEVAQITITRLLEEKDDVVMIERSDELSVLDGAGMLAMAMDVWMRTNGLREEVEE